MEKFTFEITEEIQLKSVKQYFFKVVLGRKWLALLYLVPFTLVTFFLSQEAISYGMMALIFILSMMWIKSYKAHLSQAMTQYELLDSTKISLSIDREKYIYETSSGRREMMWSKVNRVIETKDFIYALRDKTPVLAVMKSMLSAEAKSVMLKQAKAPEIPNDSPY